MNNSPPAPCHWITGQGSWKQHTAVLNPGDTLVSFTDGLLDAYDGILGSLDSIAALVRQAATPDTLMADVSALAGSPKVKDDVTLFAIRRHG